MSIFIINKAINMKEEKDLSYSKRPNTECKWNGDL